MSWKKLSWAAQDLLLGSACVGCQARGQLLCDRCAYLLGEGPIQRSVDDEVIGFHTPVMWSGTTYAPVAGRLVVSYKNHGSWSLVNPLSWLIARAVSAILMTDDGEREWSGPPILVPAPADRVRARDRGLDHTYSLTRKAAHRCGLSCHRLLKRTKRPRDQIGLSGRQRRQEQWNTMAAVRLEKMRKYLRIGEEEAPPIILVDDVVTTGATSREATRALRSAGWSVMAIACAAQTMTQSMNRKPREESCE